MGVGKKLARIAGVAAGATALGATAQPAQKVTGPIAVYWMSAQTQTGFGMPAMGAGGAGRPDTGAMMRAMMGSGGANKTLTLQLGSSQSNAAPAAEHLPPPGLEAGQSLPLVSPKKAPPEPETPGLPREYQKPRGKMLIFWGCGEHAKPGQPVVIDFAQLDPAKIQAGQSGLAALTKGFAGVTPMRPPSPSLNTTYGEWPNERTRTQVPADGSLVGEHTIQGNYSPQIRFALKDDQDFLPPLKLTTNEKGAGGWVNLGWNAVDGAEGYLATAMGGSQDTVVMWTSSETQAAAFAMPDYLSRSDIARLVQSKALMAPTTRACAVPKEAQDAMAQGGIVQLVAYAGDTNFVYPPRPSDPKVAWNQQWAVKVRYRSSTGGMLGMEMPDTGGSRYGQQRPGQPPPQQKPPSKSDILKKGILGGFGIPRP